MSQLAHTQSPDPDAVSQPDGSHRGSATRVWTIRLVMWLAIAGLFATALHYDVALMRWRYSHFPEGPEGLFKQLVFGLRDFGQILPLVVAIIIVARCDRRRVKIIAAILLAQLIAALAPNLTKAFVVRQRPLAAIDAAVARSHAKNLPDDQKDLYGLSILRGQDTWLGFVQGTNRDHETQSFPSGHSAAAFALGGVLAVCYPRLAVLFWCLAAGCAFSRYIDAVHWVSDCLAGGTIGYTAAWIAAKSLRAADSIHRGFPGSERDSLLPTQQTDHA